MLSSAVIKYLRSVNYDREHFLLECKTLEETRKTQMVKLYEVLEQTKKRGGMGWYTDSRTK